MVFFADSFEESGMELFFIVVFPGRIEVILFDLGRALFQLKDKGGDRALRQNVRIRRRAGFKEGCLGLVEHDEVHGKIPDGVSDVIDDDPAQFRPVLGVETGAAAFDNDLMRQFLKRLDVGKTLNTHASNDRWLRFLGKANLVTFSY